MSDEYIKREDAIKAFDPSQRQDWYTPWIVETLEGFRPQMSHKLGMGDGKMWTECKCMTFMGF